ncbi:MAG: protoporphyrinogen IX oxidase [Bacteroidetes bacterium]|nr:MAG: protoporphyrinogen IX oxidase [Bacteroidota bacterium]
MYQYLKAIHIIFVVTWFAGIFYMPRFFIYNTEAGEKPDIEKNILRKQFAIMMRRLWIGITWPSAILTLIFGPVVMGYGHWEKTIFEPAGRWLLIKLIFVIFLYFYFISLHRIYKQQLRGIFKYTSQQLRILNEVATIFLVAIVMLAVVKDSMSLIWGLIGLLGLAIILLSAVTIYKIMRERK